MYIHRHRKMRNKNEQKRRMLTRKYWPPGDFNAGVARYLLNVTVEQALTPDRMTLSSKPVLASERPMPLGFSSLKYYVMAGLRAGKARELIR